MHNTALIFLECNFYWNVFLAILNDLKGKKGEKGEFPHDSICLYCNSLSQAPLSPFFRKTGELHKAFGRGQRVLQDEQGLRQGLLHALIQCLPYKMLRNLVHPGHKISHDTQRFMCPLHTVFNSSWILSLHTENVMSSANRVLHVKQSSDLCTNSSSIENLMRSTCNKDRAPSANRGLEWEPLFSLNCRVTAC